MRVLFLLFHGFSDVSGITKKVLGQVKGLCDNNAEVDLAYYAIDDNGIRSWVVADKPVVTLGKGVIGKIRKRIDFSALAQYINQQKYELIYIRSFHNANPFTITFLKKIHKNSAKILLEIPTYPYDQEYTSWWEKLTLSIDKLFRKQLVKNVDAIVTFSEDKYIFGKKTIQISNGIDFSKIPLHTRQHQINDEIHLIVVAEIHYWHGIDRIIEALTAYYSKSPDQRIYLHIVGDYFGERERYEIEELIAKYNLDQYIIRYGALYGAELDAVFNNCDFAIGSLGRHRTGIERMRSLKNREYAARGMSFAYAESDPDFDTMPYVVRVSPDEQRIDLSPVIAYIRSTTIDPLYIRNSIQHLSWTNQMKTLLEAVSEL